MIHNRCNLIRRLVARLSFHAVCRRENLFFGIISELITISNAFNFDYAATSTKSSESSTILTTKIKEYEQSHIFLSVLIDNSLYYQISLGSMIKPLMALLVALRKERRCLYEGSEFLLKRLRLISPCVRRLQSCKIQLGKLPSFHMEEMGKLEPLHELIQPMQLEQSCENTFGGQLWWLKYRKAVQFHRWRRNSRDRSKGDLQNRLLQCELSQQKQRPPSWDDRWVESKLIESVLDQVLWVFQPRDVGLCGFEHFCWQWLGSERRVRSQQDEDGQLGILHHRIECRRWPTHRRFLWRL